MFDNDEERTDDNPPTTMDQQDRHHNLGEEIDPSADTETNHGVTVPQIDDEHEYENSIENDNDDDDDNDDFVFIYIGYIVNEEYAYRVIKKAEIALHLTQTALNAFANCRHLQSVAIHGRVTTLNDETFAHCVQLQHISFANQSTLQYIGADTFTDCSTLQTIELPDSVECIGDSAFSGCVELSNIKLPKTR